MFEQYITRPLGVQHDRRRASADEVRTRIAFGKAIRASVEECGLRETNRILQQEGISLTYVLPSRQMASRFGERVEDVAHLPMTVVRTLAHPSLTVEQVDRTLAKIARGELAPKVADILYALFPQQKWVEVPVRLKAARKVEDAVPQEQAQPSLSSPFVRLLAHEQAQAAIERQQYQERFRAREARIAWLKEQLAAEEREQNMVSVL